MKTSSTIFHAVALAVALSAIVSADCGSEYEAISKDPDVVMTENLLSGAVSATFKIMGNAAEQPNPTLTLDITTDVIPQYGDYALACKEAGGEIQLLDTIEIACNYFTAVEENYPACVGPSCTEEEVQEFANENVLPIVKDVMNVMPGLECTVMSGDEPIQGNFFD